jgi:hypothetical protein
MPSSVLLPHPDGPTTATNSSSAMSSDTSSSAVNVVSFKGKVFTTSRKEILAGVAIGAVVIGAPASW